MSTFFNHKIWGKVCITVDNSGDTVDKGQKKEPQVSPKIKDKTEVLIKNPYFIWI